MRWHYRDPLLVWLFPVSFGLHIVEEWFGGFPEWVALLVGSELPRPAFITINAIAMLVMVMAARATIVSEKSGWMGIAIATIVFVNGVAHLLGSLVTRTYSPGLFTAIVLYLPLGQLALTRAWLQSREGMFGRGVMAGVAVHTIVVLVAYALAT